MHPGGVEQGEDVLRCDQIGQINEWDVWRDQDELRQIKGEDSAIKKKVDRRD